MVLLVAVGPFSNECQRLASQSQFGRSIEVCADIDADECSEFAVSGGTFEDAYVQVVSGKSGAYLSTIKPAHPAAGFGHSVVNAGDWDGDGCDELVIGSPFPGKASRPRIGVYSTRDATCLAVFEARADEHSFGLGIDVLSDRDGDGRPEVLALSELRDGGYRFVLMASTNGDRLFQAETLERPSTRTVLGATGDLDGDGTEDFWITRGNQVEFVSGKTLSPLAVVEPSRSVFGLCATGDINADGSVDFALSLGGSYWSDSEWTVEVYSGKTRKALFTLECPGAGFALCSAGDLNKDGILDIAVTRRTISVSRPTVSLDTP